jgi:hypothetical protein
MGFGAQGLCQEQGLRDAGRVGGRGTDDEYGCVSDLKLSIGVFRARVLVHFCKYAYDFEVFDTTMDIDTE